VQGKQLIQSGVGPGGKFFEYLFEPGVWIDAVELGCPDQGLDGSARTPARSDPEKSQFFLPMAMGRIVFSIRLLSMGQSPRVA
jgi:hypothetical protein